MGGHKRRMGRRGPNNKNRGARDAQAVDGQAGGDGYDFPKNNEDFERFYKELGIVPEGEWEDFMAALRRELPVTFRLSAIQGCRDPLHAQLVGDCFGLARPAGQKVRITCPERGGVISDYELAPPEPLSWYPDGNGWYFASSRRVVRKSPELLAFHNFLVRNDGDGQVVRQEAVSMIPPLFLQVEPHHFVLDMCAAPGSKTSQLLEALYIRRDTNGRPLPVLGNEFPTGLVVANDADNRRGHMLAHRLKPLGSPNFIVVNHDGQFFPKIADTAEAGRPKFMLFDRVLCDVPCTGDGTMRKNPAIWAEWHNTRGVSLHGLQLQIAVRGAQLLKPGGQMVYSTCSMCPYENEAVVAALLKACPELELVDVSDQLPGLRRMPGLLHWKVITRDWVEMESPEAEANQNLRWAASFWPPADAAELNLERCVRVLPHHQDTGGFFIALIRRKELPTDQPQPEQEDEELKQEQSENVSTSEDASAETAAAPAMQDDDPAEAQVAKRAAQLKHQRQRRLQNQRQNGPPLDDDLRPLPREVGQKLVDFYGLAEGFDPSCLFTRSQQAGKVYCVPPLAARILREPRNERLKIVGAGTRVFESPRGNNTNPVDEVPRLVQEGAHLVYPFMSKQTAQVGWELFLRLLDGEPIAEEASKSDTVIPAAAVVPAVAEDAVEAPSSAAANADAAAGQSDPAMVSDEEQEPPARRPKLAPQPAASAAVPAEGQQSLSKRTARNQQRRQHHQGSKVPAISKNARNIALEEIEAESPELAATLRQLAPGSVLLELKDPRTAQFSSRPFLMATRWTGRKLCTMMGVVERQSLYSILIGGDPSDDINDEDE